MKRNTKLHFIQSIILLFTLISISPAYSIDTKAQWDAAYTRIFGNSVPYINETSANDNDGGPFAWQCHYWIRAYLSMAKAFGDASYMDKASRLIDHILRYTDAARVARGEINLASQPYYTAPQYFLTHRGQPAPGWRRFYPGEGWRVQALDDGMICQAIMRFVKLVHTDGRFSAFNAKAQQYTAGVEKVVNSHNEEFVYDREPDIPGSYYYPRTDGSGLYAGAVPLNHSCTMAVALLLLDEVKGGVPEYRKKAEAIWRYWKSHLTINSDNSYTWDYNPQSGNPVEDFNHAHIDIGFLNLAYRSGLGLTQSEMQRFVNTLLKKVHKGGVSYANFVDGTGSASDSGLAVGYDWIDLADINSQVLSIAKQTYNQQFSAPTWSRPFLGWAEILRLSNASTGISKPQNPKNLHVISPN